MTGLLAYSAICSLDGYVADEEGRFEWSAPDEEVHAAVNELSAGVGTYLLGRRMYEVLSVWDDPAMLDDPSPAIGEFAELWAGADKIVHSRTLTEVDAPRTRLVRTFDPDAVRRLKADADRDLAVGGPGLAAHAFRAGLVDEIHLFVNPVVVGGGLRALPDGVRSDLSLLDERRFANGVVQVRYRCG